MTQATLSIPKKVSPIRPYPTTHAQVELPPVFKDAATRQARLEGLAMLNLPITCAPFVPTLREAIWFAVLRVAYRLGL